jgi:hypothetical protein
MFFYHHRRTTLTSVPYPDAADLAVPYPDAADLAGEISYYCIATGNSVTGECDFLPSLCRLHELLILFLLIRISRLRGFLFN